MFFSKAVDSLLSPMHNPCQQLQDLGAYGWTWSSGGLETLTTPKTVISDPDDKFALTWIPGLMELNLTQTSLTHFE